jgi:YD repeat-containing protein
MPNTVQYTEPRRKLHLSHHIAIGMLVMGILCIIGVGIILPTWQHLSDQWTYGDARVAHASISNTTEAYAYDVQGFLVVEVWMKGKQQTFTTPLSGQGRAVITLQVFDVNGDGYTDIVVGIEGSNASFVLFGNGVGYQTTIPK